MKKIIAIIILILLSSTIITAVSISPTELRIKNSDPSKAYKFIILVSSQEEGLVDIEMKSSEKGISISPNKFMLNKGEKKSIQIGFIGKQIPEDVNKILIQAYVNNEPSESRMHIYLEKGDLPSEIQDLEVQQEKWWLDKEMQRIMIYVLAIVLAILMIALLLPEMKRRLKKLKMKNDPKHKIKAKKRKQMNISKRIIKIDSTLKKTEDTLKKLTLKVEKFYNTTNTWLMKNSNGKHRLE